MIYILIKKNDNNNSQQGPGRALSYQLFENRFNHLWIYLTHASIDSIIEKFTPMEKTIDTKEYIKEYIQPELVE